MSEVTNKILAEISDKFDTLIALMKISNKDALERYKQQLSKDRVFSSIMDTLQEPVSYTDLSRRVSQALGVAEITVKKKLSELKDMGLVKAVRRGREVYYEKSGLVD